MDAEEILGGGGGETCQINISLVEWKALRENKGPLVLSADKSDAMVLKDRTDYNEKVKGLLLDKAYCKDLIVKVEHKLGILIKMSALPQKYRKS